LTVLFKNGASDDIIGPASTLASGVSVGAVSLTVAAGTGDRFPVVASPDIAYVTLQNATKIEIVKITARTAGADTMTIVKAQEGTTDRAWLTGDVVSMRITAAQAESSANAQAVATTALAAAISTHEGAANPHPGYAVDADVTAVSAAVSAHLADATDAHAASAITNTPAGNIAATTVQAAINELDSEKEVAGAAAAHIADATDAHAASAISFTPTGTIAATDVQAAIAEVASESGGMTLLGTLTTTSGATQTFSGLDLSTYKFVLFSIEGISPVGSETLKLGGQDISIANATALKGLVWLELTAGYATSMLTDVGDTPPGAVYTADTTYSTASTSLAFTWSGSADFDAGTIRAWGFK
jgi:hypothetical protein